jgi:hypothetical protein
VMRFIGLGIFSRYLVSSFMLGLLVDDVVLGFPEHLLLASIDLESRRHVVQFR